MFNGGHMKAKGTLVGVGVFAVALLLCEPAAAASAKKSKAKKKPVEKPAVAETYCPPIDGAEIVGPGGQSGILERMMEKKESATRGEGFANESDHEGDAWNQWFFSQRKYPAKTLPPDAIGKALRAAKRNNTSGHWNATGMLATRALAATPSWTALGPSQIPGGQTDTTHGGPPGSNPYAAGTVSGRVSAIAVDPTDPNVVYCGGAQGGVWKTTNALAASPTWTPISDFEASLAIGDIAIDPVDHNIIYVGTGEANGSCDSYYGQGILRSTDGGATWTLFNGGGFFTNEAISRIVIDPDSAGSATSTTLWASTVLGFFASGTEDCNAPPGAYNGALFRSTDSGQTWEVQDVPTGAAGSARVHDLGLDPENSNFLYVAVRGFPEATGGIWRSNNAKAKNAHFNKVDTKFAQVDVADPPVRRITLGVGHEPTQPLRRTLYAALGALGENLWGFYKSTNGGATWAHVDAGNNGQAKVLGTTITRKNGPPFTKSMEGHRIILDNRFSRSVKTCPPAPCGFVNSDTLIVTSPVTTVQTEMSWSVASYPLYCSGQCFYDMTIGVDPADPTANTVYVGGNPHTYNLDTSGVPGGHYNWRTLDGGSTWRAVSQGNSFTNGLHTDDHAIAFDTSVSPSRVYDGNDGGIWSSDDQGVSWKNLNTNIAITQFQGVALTAADPSRVLGGTQDNGTNILNYGGVTPPAWFHTDFGDGGQAIIDQSNADRMFHTYFNQSFNFYGPARTFPVAGLPGSWPFAGCYFGYGPQYYNGLGECTDPVSFYAPLASNPSFTPDVIYFGTDRVYRSPSPQPTLFGVPSWTAVSPSLTNGGFVSAIGVFNGTVGGTEVVYAGSAFGELHVSFDVPTSGAGTWTDISAGLPPRFVSEIEVDSADVTGKTAYATFSGFNDNSPGFPGHVFKTTNGATWTDITGDLPDIPATCIALMGSSIYLGTDIGVFQSDDNGAHWVFIDNGLPHVAVFGLDRNLATGDIVASTHGRGMFQLVP
jgi:hypothetical protein